MPRLTMRYFSRTDTGPFSVAVLKSPLLKPKSCVFLTIFLGLLVTCSADDLYSEESNTDHAHVDTDKKSERIEIDNRCNEKLGTCYTVWDEIDQSKNEPVGRRILGMPINNRTALSDAVIKPDNDDNEADNSDTRNWKIDKSIVKGYIAMMAATPFVFERFNMHSDEEQSVLLLGLGGATLDNFLRIHKPKVKQTVVEIDQVVIDIARKWFDLEEDEYRRIIKANGTKYVRKTAKKGETQYDAVFLDACDHIQCPAPSFLTVSAARNLKMIIKDSGILVMNVIHFTIHRNDYLKELNVYTRAFGKCFLADHRYQYNILLVCFPSSNPINTENLGRYQKRYQNLMKRFNLPEEDGDVVLLELS